MLEGHEKVTAEAVVNREEVKVTARPATFVAEALQHFARFDCRQALRHVYHFALPSNACEVDIPSPHNTLVNQAPLKSFEGVLNR